jgi:hypothetical protein
MYQRILFLLFVLGTLPAFCSEPDTAPHLESSYTLRTGEQLQGPHVLTYRLFEYSQQRDRWILPDFGYYDIGSTRERIVFTGVGAELVHNPRFVWTQVLYVAEWAGPAAHHERDLWIWPVLDARLSPRLSGEMVVYPTIPLNRAARWELDVDRAKLEYAARPWLKTGAGYSACVGANTGWTNKPLLTATFTGRAGSWEFWLERMPGGGQVQMRYSLVRKGY